MELVLLDRVAEHGILGLGWALFIYMMIERRFERKKYAELVVHIVTYFTKVGMVERSHSDALGILQTDLFTDSNNSRSPPKAG